MKQSTISVKIIKLNENLTRTNESIAFCGRKLKGNGVIHLCYTRDGIVHIKKQTFESTLKVHHMNFLYNAFPQFAFFEDDGSELFHDASPLKKTKKNFMTPFYG